ncbi:hypothetical protein RclHR1_18300009 [Rhizophagus clarus]|uniref:Uncharacterized protein n=1 Tax=Rhizophagus clarus TaxID=94130 RepID=A0A2Z6QAB3_9GLOM|nr:hypothetical protein RclHR1_13560012 [Rhizophagus clarus]GBB91170.1 hypothetical protein RclHR1_18300009 [Rhizophagus clarus]
MNTKEERKTAVEIILRKNCNNFLHEYLLQRKKDASFIESSQAEHDGYVAELEEQHRLNVQNAEFALNAFETEKRTQAVHCFWKEIEEETAIRTASLGHLNIFGRTVRLLLIYLQNKKQIDSPASKKVKTTSRNVDDDDDDFISSHRAEESMNSRSHSKDTSSPSSSQSLKMQIGTESAGSSRGATEMTSGINEINSPEYDRPHTPPHQIRSTSENQDLLKRLRQEKQRTKSTYEPICSSIIDTTNKLLMDRLKIKRNYTWDPSDTRNEFRRKLQLPFVSTDETYSFNKHYEIHWVHRFADKLSLFFEAPRNPLLDKNSEGWINCHLLTPLIDDCFLSCEEIQVHRGEEMSLASIERKNMTREDTEKKRSGHKIDILFRIDNMEYFGSETYTDEDPQNSKPINYKHKVFREMKDQLDRILNNLKFTEESIKGVKNIVLHGITHGGLNGKMCAMYYDADIRYYFVFKTCQYRIGTTWGSIPESLVALKDVLSLKNDITNVLGVVKKVKRVALQTRPEDLFTIDNLPETTPTPKKSQKE